MTTYNATFYPWITQNVAAVDIAKNIKLKMITG